MASFVVGAGRGHDLPMIVAAVRGAGGADPPARSRRSSLGHGARRFADANGSRKRLSAATGKNIEVKVVIDPDVMGGVVATIGDTVIDGTVRHRLEQLKETL